MSTFTITHLIQSTVIAASLLFGQLQIPGREENKKRGRKMISLISFDWVVIVLGAFVLIVGLIALFRSH